MPRRRSPTTEPQPSPSPSRPARGWRIAISLVLLFHLTAIVVGPWSVPPSSILSQETAQTFRPYLELLYLNHGYKFFAPDPGRSSRLIRYELELPDGRTVEGIFPDREQHWPRLRYHRHFMLSEKSQLFPEELVRSYARHLLQVYGAHRVTLYERKHNILTPADLRTGKDPAADSTYEETRWGSFTPEELALDPSERP